MGWLRGLKLGTRFTLIVIGCVCAVVIVVATYLLMRHDTDLTNANLEKSRMMREEVGKRGLAIARNVAHASERALAMQDYLFLQEIINTTVAGDEEIVFAMLMNLERRALVHSDLALGGTVLEDEAAKTAVQQKEPLVTEREHDGKPIIEVVAPINVAGKVWGAARFAWSLEKLNAEIAQREKEIRKQLALGVLTSIIVTIVLMAVAIALAVAASGAVVRPLHRLMKGVNWIREGNLDHKVKAEGSPELADLATAFNEMTLAIRHRETSLASALAQAQEANRLKSEFLANISHELRTPLNAIVNVPGSLLEDYETVLLWACDHCDQRFEPDPDAAVDGDEAQEKCPNCNEPLELRNETFFTGDADEHRHLNQRALSSGEYLLRVVNDLLDFSKLQAGRMKLFIDTVKIVDVVEELRGTMESLAEARGVKVIYPSLDDSVELQIDAVKLVQVLINLVGNAIKFTDSGGEVEVRFIQSAIGDDGMVTFSVRDTGIGIPESQIETIFDTFRQVDGSHTRSHGGTGLGLSITRQLVELQGGKVWVDSKLGEGSTFHFTLPKKGQPIDEVADLATRGTWGNDLTSVVVDDDDTYNEVVRKMMTDVGMKVELVSEPRDAVDVVKMVQPSFVLLDVMMPRLSGVGVLRLLRDEDDTSQIPVLVSTAYHANREVVMELGGLWLPKPWRMQDLIKCLVDNKVLDDDPRSSMSRSEVGEATYGA